MLNAYTFGFACVAAVAVAGVDYAMQAKTAGMSFGSYPLGDYIGSYSARFSDVTAERDKARRQAEPARVHLPEAPEGWERREWIPDLGDDPMPVHDGMTQQQREIAATMKKNLIARMEHEQAVKMARKAAESQAWEYVRGDETIRLSALYDTANGPQSRQEPATEIVAASMGLPSEGLEGYGMVQGVPFFRVTGPTGGETADAGEGHPDRPVRLMAYIGEEISLGVNADAADESIRLFLERIDYDGLNMMLDRPVADIGGDAPELTPEEALELADAALRLRTGTPGRTSREPETATSAESGAFNQAKAGSLASTVTGSSSGGGNPDGGGDREAEPKPTRLKLSGGNACLSGSSGRFCKN